MDGLNDYIIEHLKKGNYEKTLKLFEEKNGGPTEENSKICEKFVKHLKNKETEKENEIDDLGFEINFGAFQPEPKVSDLSNNVRDMSCDYDSILTFSCQHQAVEKHTAKAERMEA